MVAARASSSFFIRVVTDAIQGKASAQKMLLALMARFVPTTADAAHAGNAEDSVAMLFDKIDLMAKRRREMPPDEK